MSRRTLIRRLADKDMAWPFLLPVDPEVVPDYHRVIRRPMDLSTVYARLKGMKGDKEHYFGQHTKFAKDMRLVFRNCIQYNAEGSEIAENAERLLDEFEDLYGEWVANTARKKFDDVLAKLPELPVEWLELGSGGASGAKDDKTIENT